MKAARQYPWLAAGLVLAAGAAAWAFWPSSADAPPPDHAAGPAVDPEPPPPDPRLTFDTPFRNVKPDVRYLGDAACSGCHADIDKSYHQHPMGRSAAVVGDGPAVEKYDPDARNPFAVHGYTLRADRTPGGVVHRVSAARPDGEPLPDYAVTADVAIGSGARGRSYLTVDRGAVWQSPLSWYGHEGRWDLSPGYDLGGNGGRRAVVPECLFCHVDRVDPVPGSRNRYRDPLLPGQAAIGCERCHGPGELHAAERAGGAAPAGPDTSIVNPRHLPPALRSAVCEQCHLQGQERVVRRGRDVWEYRPGLPFGQFVSVFVRHPSLAQAHRSVGQFEQMEASKCYTASAGRLGCTSCHDPHAAPDAGAKAGFYRARCLTCHETKGCTAPEPDRRAKADSCVACHMPRAGSANIVHTSITDHRVPRRPGPPAPPAGVADRDPLPVVPFRA
ncbi:MAG: hypothetical protein K2X82_27325, partial [Gemmataceae bacterium]|nr:hypothetical protein [Gemmataceae bacterium]